MSATPAPTRAAVRRLREVYRSAGWPCQDALELELLAAGWIERVPLAPDRWIVRLTDAGVQAAAVGVTRNRRALSAHQTLVERVAESQLRMGRIAFTELEVLSQVGTRAPGPQALRTPLPGMGMDDVAGAAGSADSGGAKDSGRADALGGATGSGGSGDAVGSAAATSATIGAPVWQRVRPDVFSFRHTTVAGYLEPAVFEVKVSRADLLGDLRNPAKRAGYEYLAGPCTYVLAEGIGSDADLPAECGLVIATATSLERVRWPAQRTAREGFPLGVWMALARAVPFGHDRPMTPMEDAQRAF